jgi:hypothetical protein
MREHQTPNDALQLVTDVDEARRLGQALTKASICDLVLDDGTYVPDTAVVDSHAVGTIVGGQTGFLPFAEVPALASRHIEKVLLLSGIHRVPLLGRWLRHSWATCAGACLAKPYWMPRL